MNARSSCGSDALANPCMIVPGHRCRQAGPRQVQQEQIPQNAHHRPPRRPVRGQEEEEAQRRPTQAAPQRAARRSRRSRRGHEWRRRGSAPGEKAAIPKERRSVSRGQGRTSDGFWNKYYQLATLVALFFRLLPTAMVQHDLTLG